MFGQLDEFVDGSLVPKLKVVGSYWWVVGTWRKKKNSKKGFGSIF
jgi:hypothetical protein